METVIKICRTSFLCSALVRTESFLCHMREMIQLVTKSSVEEEQ